MGDVLLELREVTKSFGDGLRVEILHGLSFTLNRGEFAALIGPSGSGKSTLLNLIGLLDRPTTGEIHFDNQPTAGLSEAALTQLRARSLGFVFQFHHLLPAFTAAENVLMPLLADRGRPDAQMRSRASELLARVGLGGREGARVADLSGGEQQRVAISRALAVKPLLVLADEPTGNLDTATADAVFALLREMNRDEHTTFLIVTHDPRLAARCDRVIELVDGRIRDDRRVD